MKAMFACGTALALGGCATTAEQMTAKPPVATYHSDRAREAVSNCLLDRVSDAELRPQVSKTHDMTMISFASRGLGKGPILYLFIVTDDTGGSKTEVRRFAHASLSNAETCF